MSIFKKIGSIVTWPGRQIVNGVRYGVGVDAIKTGASLIERPLDRRNYPAGQDVSYLKSLEGDDLLWALNVEPSAVMRLIQTLRLEIVLWFGLFCLGAWNVIYFIYNPQYSVLAMLIGIVIGIIAIMQMLLRYHWSLIVRRQKYRTFREFLSGKK